MQKRIAVIGAGYAGMTAAAILGSYGHEVSVFEKNDSPGGRAGQIREEGFIFDKGPSFYWMPDVFERFFNQFGKSASDFYQLKRLDPSYKIFWADRPPISMPADQAAVISLFESIESGAGMKLKSYLEEAKIKYEVGMGDFVYMPSMSLTEYVDIRLLKEAFSLDLFTSISKHIASHFKNDYLRQILEFPVLFLGAKPQDTPALYSLMNYADITLGTWYPIGGMYEVSKAMYQVGVDQGVQYHFASEVIHINPNKNNKVDLHFQNNESDSFDYVISGADYQHTEAKLLSKNLQSYTPKYWDSRALAPSALLYFLGFDTVLPNLEHHSLFFDASFDYHAREIYDEPAWPKDPLFYTNSSSLTDPDCAPAGYHNLVALIPVSTSLEDTEEVKARYLDIILERLSKHTGIPTRQHLIFQKSYAQRDFIREFHSFKGNAYGLANTLMQTGPLRPKIQSKKIPNLFYCGQLTVPGPGLPPSIISGEIVARFVHRKILA